MRLNNLDLDVNKIRKDFPLLSNHGIIYLDNAATSQKPRQVLDAEHEFYEKYNANPFRGLYELSELATEQYEMSRKRVQQFIHARETEEIIFTRNTTEGLNLVAYSLVPEIVKPGDEIIVCIEEHHSNMLPWRQAAKRMGAVIVYLECGKDGLVTEEMVRQVITPRTKLIAITQISNVFGRLNDLKMITQICHETGIVVVADGAQSVPHIEVNVQELDVDFLAFSGHKMLAPMGIGVLYGKRKWLEMMPPFLTGGEMIESVTRTGESYAELPHKFEAGTVNAAGAVSLAKAIDYMESVGFQQIRRQEEQLCNRAIDRMSRLPHVHIIGDEDPANHHGIITFTIEGVHPHDVASILDADHIAVRAGHHCAQPLLHYLGVNATTRASIAFYNTVDEIEQFTNSVSQIRRRLGYE